MTQFLLCSTVFKKRQYTVLRYEEKVNLVEKLGYLLNHRQDAVIWPLFSKSDKEELLYMDKSLSAVLKGIVVDSDACKIRYNGWIYQIDEITLSKDLPGYWRINTNCGMRSFDPSSIEFLSSQRS